MWRRIFPMVLICAIAMDPLVFGQVGIGSAQAFSSFGIVPVPASLFLPVVTYNSGGYFPTALAIADVNGDGKPDLLVASTCMVNDCSTGEVSVLLGNGNGTFNAPVSYSSGGAGATSLAVSDVNGDKKADIVVANCGPFGLNTCGVANSGNGVLGVLIGNGDGTFQTAVKYDSGGKAAASVAVADINRDNNPDLLVADECGSTSTCLPGSAGVLLGNGDGTFQPAVVYDTKYDVGYISAEDVSGDGNLDLLLASRGNNRVGVLIGNGDGTFQPIAIYQPGGISTSSIVAADVNADGTRDLLVSNGCAIGGCTSGSASVLKGNGGGSFQAPVSYNSGGRGSRSLGVADLDGDGAFDLVVANPFDDTVSVLLGNGDASFQFALTYGSGAYHPTSVAVSDVNGDRQPDMVVVNACVSSVNCSNGVVSVLLNQSLPPDSTPPAITLTATPTVLWPPTERMVRVRIFGRIAETGSGLREGSLEYAVTDEYRLVQPRGHFTVNADGTYSFAILLRASREGRDKDGRRYIIRVSASDKAGNRGAAWQTVIVPHDTK